MCVYGDPQTAKLQRPYAPGVCAPTIYIYVCVKYRILNIKGEQAMREGVRADDSRIGNECPMNVYIKTTYCNYSHALGILTLPRVLRRVIINNVQKKLNHVNDQRLAKQKRNHPEGPNAENDTHDTSLRNAILRYGH